MNGVAGTSRFSGRPRVQRLGQWSPGRRRSWATTPPESAHGCLRIEGQGVKVWRSLQQGGGFVLLSSPRGLWGVSLLYLLEFTHLESRHLRKRKWTSPGAHRSFTSGLNWLRSCEELQEQVGAGNQHDRGIDLVPDPHPPVIPIQMLPHIPYIPNIPNICTCTFLHGPKCLEALFLELSGEHRRKSTSDPHPKHEHHSAIPPNTSLSLSLRAFQKKQKQHSQTLHGTAIYAAPLTPQTPPLAVPLGSPAAPDGGRVWDSTTTSSLR